LGPRIIVGFSGNLFVEYHNGFLSFFTKIAAKPNMVKIVNSLPIGLKFSIRYSCMKYMVDKI